MVFQIILNFRKYAPLEKTPSLLLTPKFLHRFFPHVNTPYRASSGNFHSVVDWVHEYINTKLLSPCFLATAKFFVARTGNACLHESSPLTTDEASCFGASWLSINASAADFPYYNFSEATVLQKATPDIVIVEFTCIQDYAEWRESVYVWDELNIWANEPSPLCPKVVCKKGAYFRKLI